MTNPNAIILTVAGCVVFGVCLPHILRWLSTLFRVVRDIEKRVEHNREFASMDERRMRDELRSEVRRLDGDQDKLKALKRLLVKEHPSGQVEPAYQGWMQLMHERLNALEKQTGNHPQDPTPLYDSVVDLVRRVHALENPKDTTCSAQPDYTRYMQEYEAEISCLKKQIEKLSKRRRVTRKSSVKI